MTSKDLDYVEKSATILMGYEIASGTYDGRRLSIVASGNTVRFRLAGSDGHVDLKLDNYAALAAEWLAEHSTVPA